MLKDQPLAAFLDRLASASATPGGGSAAAVMGAIGAALVGMVAHLTLGKAKYQAAADAMQAILTQAENLRQRLLQAAEADIAAFDEVMRAWRLPKQTEDDKARREAALQAALKAATQAPLTCASLCAEVIGLCRTAAEQGNPSAITDAGVGALAARTALQSCALNVEVNLRAVCDQEFVRACRKELEQALIKSSEVESILQTITTRLGL
ncbi:MAG: cyclodeaminase/cyclohydrolase family protein [Methylohalobius sp.]|nr:cyclodeaminase/cyclohydrolase family protein [Methylohalobius sp.]